MMPDKWWSEAARDPRAWTCYGMAGDTTARRVIVHSTENSVSTDPSNVADYMWSNAGAGTGYHLLMPVTGTHRPLQLRPASCGAGSLRNTGSNPGGVSPNKTGAFALQVSLVGYARDSHAASDLGPWWPAFLDWVDSWDVPRDWVWRNWSDGARMPTGTYWGARSGWTAHQQIPTQDHTDPGRVDPDVLWGGVEVITDEDLERISRATLTRHAWPYAEGEPDQHLQAHISRIRRKLDTLERRLAELES